MSLDEVVSTVRSEFDDYRKDIHDFPAVEIVEDGVKQEDDWWYVPVIRLEAGIRAYTYYDHLNAIEGRLRQHHGYQVLFIPALAA